MSNLVSIATGIMIATFEGSGSAQWNTPTGNRPAAEANLAVWIFTPVKMAPQTVLRSSVGTTASHRIKGGTIGCDTDTYDDTPKLAVGATYAVFAVPEWDKSAASADPWILWAWLVEPDGTLQTPLDGSVTIDQLSQAVTQLPVATSGSSK